jgi:hypothetical protein
MVRKSLFQPYPDNNGFSGFLFSAEFRVWLKQSLSVSVALKNIAEIEKIDPSSNFSDLKCQDINNLRKK